MESKTIQFNAGEKIRSEDFEKERDLCAYIVEYIEDFCRDVLGDEYVSHELEVQAVKQWCFMVRGSRVDMRIVCKKETYLIELKNPRSLTENRAALGQILCYSVMLDPLEECKLVIVTSMFDILTAKAIKRFAIPVRYIYFEKDRMLEYLGDS